jgi:hypothetical protein
MLSTTTQQLHYSIFFITNNLMQKHNGNVFTNTSSLTFIFKAIDINHSSCTSFYKLSKDLNKIACLHSIIHI